MNNDTLCDLSIEMTSQLTHKQYIQLRKEVMNLGLVFGFTESKRFEREARVALLISKNRKVHELAKRILELV